ncbi:ATP-binding protein [Glycomyces salinus]|uniref:ATP-binding protein n=1 Tax=Glycomyces salinus TaxID=980294 RepID=UPI0018EA3DD1|nr:ATP-binding protein [Glycomyces salinus]
MVQIPPSPIGALLPRHAADILSEAMTDTRVVLVNGARQCGKSTLAMQAGKVRGAEWRTLDDPQTLQFARDNPGEFVETDRTMIIDEIQRAPELLLPVKYSVDQWPQPGKFLLTGSARVMGLRNLPDTLVGRMETVELWPLSQGEIDGRPDDFIDAIFEHGADFRHSSGESRRDYIDRITRGGFPTAVARTGQRRDRFFSAYIADLINRDVMELERIRRTTELRRMVDMLAGTAGQLLVQSTLANRLGITQPTVSSYLGLLEEVFLVKRIPAWSRNISTRAVKTPKLAFVDSGMAAHLLGIDAHRLRRPGAPLGPLLENFVTMEIARQLTWAREQIGLYHYRTKDKTEVDIVLENRRGEVVAIEVKAAETVKSEDFKGLRNLAGHLGGDLLLGAVLYTGRHTLTIDSNMLAIPISALWEGPTD